MADWLDDVVAPRESGGRPNIGWGNTDLTPWLKAGKTVYGFPDWPGKPSGSFDKSGRELPSTAAGKYMITKTNWLNLAPGLGVNDFSLASQRKIADALMATQGKSAWAASEPGYKSGLRSPAGPAEGYYDGSLHVTLRPDKPEFPMDAALDALLGGKPIGGAEAGEEHPLLMLDRLLEPGPAEGKPATQTAPGDDFIEPPGALPEARNLFAEQGPLDPGKFRTMQALPAGPRRQEAPPAHPAQMLGRLLDGEPIEPPAQGQSLPQPAAMPPVPPAPAMLDTLLGGAVAAMRAGGDILTGMSRGVRRGAEAGFTGQPIEREGEPRITSAAEAAGAIPGVIGGGLLSPLRAGGEALHAAMTGQPVAAHEMLTAGMAGMDPAARLPGGVPGEVPGIHRVARGVLASEQGAGAIPLPPQLVQGVKNAGKGIEKVFSPSTVDPASGAGEMLFRREIGQARRSTERAEAQVGARGPLANPPAADMIEAAREPWRPLVQRHIPEFKTYVVAKQAGHNPPKPALLRFLDFVETRSRGTTYGGPPELRPLADILAKIYKERELAIAAEPSTQWAGFVEDYYAHQYRDPAGVAASMSGAGRQGHGRALRQRSIPTMSEAIDRGFEPVTLDPIDMTMRYVTNMDRYLAHNRIFRIGRDSGMIRFHAPNSQPQGWAQLDGRLAERAVATGGVPEALGLKAYAPDGFARIYNNSVALGFRQGEIAAKVYDAALHTKNAITQSVLSLSGYHAMAMSQEAAASAFASGIQKLTHGDILAGLKDVGLGAIPGVKAGVDVFGAGRKMERQYRGIDDYGPDFERVANLHAGAGGRMVGRGMEYQGTAAQNYFTAFRRGQTRAEIAAGLRHIGEGNPVYAPLRAVGFVARELARINETITAPLFDKMIPRLKAAAFYDEMSEWLAKNPMATADQQLAQARTISDTMDDRFGELVMDNLFWGRRTKQTLQLAATSLGWEHGSIRSIGGSAFDAVRGQFSPRVRYVIGLGSAIALENAAYQYLKTGATPGQGTGGALSAGGALDLTMPRTGGTTPEGAAERAMLPGFEKDIVGYMHDPAGELAGKLSPAGRLGVEFFTGRDYFGRDIAPFPKYTPEWFRAYAGHVIKGMTPIPLKQEQLKGTAMGQSERFMGNRPAPERWQNPARQDRMETMHNIKDLRGELAGLYAHGGRTLQERKEIAEKARDIQAKIAKLQKDFAERGRGLKSSEYLYKPPRGLRPSVGGP